MKTMSAKVQVPGRDEMELTLELDEKGVILKAKLVGVGCPAILKQMSQLRSQLKGQVSELPLATGFDHSSLMAYELVRRIQGQWELPYQEEELCHCRAVPTAKVDEAIVTGAHCTADVSRLTSAGTGCGTCRPDIDSLIQYRLRK